MSYENELVLESLSWAYQFARRCAARFPSHLDQGDLQSAGVLGYLEASSRYDASKGASFRGYCALRIRGAVLDELRRWDWAPRSEHKRLRDTICITYGLASSGRREIVSLEEVVERYDAEDGLPLAERLADPDSLVPDAALVSREDQRMVLRCLGALSKSHATVLVLHYLQNVPLCEVAEVLHVTPARVSQLHRQALARLKVAWERTQNPCMLTTDVTGARPGRHRALQMNGSTTM